LVKSFGPIFHDVREALDNPALLLKRFEGGGSSTEVNLKQRELWTAWTDAPLESDYGMVIECEQAFKLLLVGRSVSRDAAHVVVRLNL
jgi:hypothetical protein